MYDKHVYYRNLFILFRRNMIYVELRATDTAALTSSSRQLFQNRNVSNYYRFGWLPSLASDYYRFGWLPSLIQESCDIHERTGLCFSFLQLLPSESNQLCLTVGLLPAQVKHMCKLFSCTKPATDTSLYFTDKLGEKNRNTILAHIA
ncbi:hypothetical protein ACJX0J_012971, partial [Zea mays]